MKFQKKISIKINVYKFTRRISKNDIDMKNAKPTEKMFS